MREIHSRDDGATLLTVMLAVVVLTGLVVAVTSMAVGQASFSRDSRDRSGAVHAADAGAEAVIAQVARTPTYATTTHTPCPGSSTYHCLPDGLSDGQQREWALAQYREAETAGDAAVLPVPGGRAYGLRPVRAGTTTPLDLAFGVGRVGPGDGKVRVVRVRLEAPVTPLDRALTAQGAVAVVNGASVSGGLHTNANLSVVESAAAAPITCGSTPCPGGSAGTARVLPDVRARAYHLQGAGSAGAWYDLCPDGTVRGWASMGPCSGPRVPDPRWTWRPAHQRWTRAGAVGLSGVYYAHHTSIRVSGGGEGRATLLASRDPAGNDPLQGNVWVDAAAVLTPYLPGLGIVGDRDVCVCNGGGQGRVGSAALPAAVVAGEQLYVWGSTVVGAVLALDNAWWGGPAETAGSPSQGGDRGPNGAAWDYITKCPVPDCVWQARIEAGAVSVLDAAARSLSGWREL